MITRAKSFKKRSSINERWSKQQGKNNKISAKLLNARDEKRKGSNTAAKARAGKNQQEENISSSIAENEKFNAYATSATQTVAYQRTKKIQTVTRSVEKSTQTDNQGIYNKISG